MLIRTRIQGTPTVLGTVATVTGTGMTAIRTVVTGTAVTATDPGTAVTATGIVTKMTTTEIARDYELELSIINNYITPLAQFLNTHPFFNTQLYCAPKVT